MRKLLLIFISFIILLTSCGGADTGNSYAEDYEFLWKTLEESYPYYSYLEESGLDLNEIKERYSNKVESVDDFRDNITAMFAEMGNFAHLNVVTPELFRSYYYIYVQGTDEQSPFRDVLTDERLADMYDIDEERPQEKSSALPKPQVLYYDDGKIIYLEIPTFAQEVSERDKNILSDALREHPDAENIIIDITKNTGGSDYYWVNNLVAPLGKQYEFSFRSFLKSSEITDSYYAGAELQDVSDMDVPEWVETCNLDKCFISNWTVPEEGFQPEKDVKVWVLTSDNVFSASDKFACFCKSTGFATIVGTQTSGDGLGSTPVLVLLPYSGVLVRFSAMAGENPDGSMNAREGTKPDILCGPTEDAFNKCIAIIRGE